MVLQLSQRPVTTVPHPWDNCNIWTPILNHHSNKTTCLTSFKPYGSYSSYMTLSKGGIFHTLTIKKELHSNFQKLLQLSPVSPTVTKSMLFGIGVLVCCDPYTDLQERECMLEATRIVSLPQLCHSTAEQIRFYYYNSYVPLSSWPTVGFRNNSYVPLSSWPTVGLRNKFKDGEKVQNVTVDLHRHNFDRPTKISWSVVVVIRT